MRLRVDGHVARSRMLSVGGRLFQQGLEGYWHVRPDGSVLACSLLWLYCWGDPGPRFPQEEVDCRRLWNEFTGVPFSELATSQFHKFAKDNRYKRVLTDESLLSELPPQVRAILESLETQGESPVQRHSTTPPTPTSDTSTRPPGPHIVPAGRLTAQEQQAVHGICRSTDDALWRTHCASIAGGQAGHVGLIFPNYTTHPGLRVSEQEARYLFHLALDASGQFAHSIETPTVRHFDGRAEGYVASGNGGMSARLDLTLYRPDHSRALNIEFKAGGAGTSLGGAAAKDIIKLVVEPCDGLWFAVLESTNEGTLRAILRAVWQKVEEVASRESVKPYLPTLLVFHACVLDPAFSLHRVVRLGDPTKEKNIGPQDFTSFRWPGAPPDGGPRETEVQGGWTLRQAPARPKQ